jgi:hypothetical protein
MPQNITEQRRQDFLKTLADAGGAAGNKALRERLDWEEDFYWRVQAQLIEAGEVVPGRGRGGSVKLTSASIDARTPEGSEENSGVELVNVQRHERELYKPLADTIEATWIKRFGFDEVKVAETHSRGGKDTGGTFTRPDITAVGIRRYLYLPKTMEVITFEVKPAEVVSVLGVLEAIAHREAANRSYVIYATSDDGFASAPESERIAELAQKYGVGIILADNPGSVESWDVMLDALRHEPDPARLDRFLGDLPSEEMKKQLSKWKE